MAPLPSALSPPAASRGPVPGSGPRGGAARGIEQGPLGGGGERMGPRPASRARGTAVGERGHGGRRASSSLLAAEAASERLGGAASMPGPPVARERYMRWEWRVPSRALALSTT